MGIKSIRITNLLSFDDFYIDNITDISCIIGRNNVGKSNLLKLMRFFYQKLEGKRVVPPELNSNYSAFGSITIEYDFSRLSKIINSSFNDDGRIFFKKLAYKFLPHLKGNVYEVTLTIHSNDSVEWKYKDVEILYLINFLFPFFEIEARHIDLYDWDQLWHLVSRLKSFNVDKIKHDDIIKFLDDNVSDGSNAYADYIKKIRGITKASKYTYRERIQNYIKVGLEGQTFTIDGEILDRQSDGTNAHRYIELFLELLITLTRTSYISPIVYIDEPEIGLHPKKNEELIYNLYQVYSSFKKKTKEKEVGKYSTPYPKVFMSTHSPNILKTIIRLFKENQQIFHFSKNRVTEVSKLKSVYDDLRFLNKFSDNEARLFFSEKILFVEGDTELELFSNMRLLKEFPHLQRIDVYATVDKTILKSVNPSYANVTIPYMILYDADKVLTFDFLTSKFNLVADIVKKINKLKDKTKFIRYDEYSPSFIIKESINDLELYLNKKVILDDYKIYILNDEYIDLISSINAIFRKDYTKVVATTIEGVLINKSSFDLFKKWLSYEMKNNLHAYGGENMDEIAIARRINAIKNKYKNKTFDIQRTVCALLSCVRKELLLTAEDEAFINMVKDDYIGYIWDKLSNFFGDEMQQVTVMRLIFLGKTETLVASTNEKYSSIGDSDFKKNIDDFKKEDLKPINYLFNKTSGWVTRFIDFSINWINENKADKNFERVFKLNFPELYNIISELQFR